MGKWAHLLRIDAICHLAPLSLEFLDILLCMWILGYEFF